MSDIYSTVFSALGATVANTACLASSEAKIQRALAQVRGPRGNRAAAEQLERISLMLHELSLAVMSKDQTRRQDMLERLRIASMKWVNRLPVH